MSIATEISRIQGHRNDIRAKLISLGVVVDQAADLEDCSAALQAIVDRGAVNGTLSGLNDNYIVAAGYHNGAGKVTIAQTEKDKIISSNIKAGVNILGVMGEFAGSSVTLQSKTTTPTTATQTVTPDEGYDGLSQVTVNAIPNNYADITVVTAGAGDVLASKVFVNSLGDTVAGTMANNGAVAATIDGTTTTVYTIPAGYHSGAGTVSLTEDIENALASI